MQERLEGPVNDVDLIRDVLLNSAQFDSKDITVLKDSDATKQGILRAMRQIVDIAEKGDIFILYFSGHGTSAMDNAIDSDIPTKSGALIPYDIENIKSKEDLNNRLMIGRRDLKPNLIALDNAGVSVLVLIDACYSGNTVRGENKSSATHQILEFRSNLCQ